MDKVLNNIARICRIHSVDKALLFGSRARGDHNPKSDYDIAIWCDENRHHLISSDIDDIDTLYKIDVTYVNDNTNKVFLDSIMKEGVNIVDKLQTKIENYKNALQRLKEAIEEFDATNSKTVRDGVIQRFEFTTELAWKSLREYLVNQGFEQQNSPKAVMQEAFSANCISDEEAWINILNDRNLTSHIYDDITAEEIYNRIVTKHIKAFESLFSFYTKNA